MRSLLYVLALSWVVSIVAQADLTRNELAARRSGEETYFNSRGARQLEWGKRLINATRFSVAAELRNERRWVGYFFEETIVAALQAPNRYMVDCNVIEVSKEREQREALEDIGVLMELVPISMNDMVRLIKLCGSLHPFNSPSEDNTVVEASESRSQPKLTFGSMVLPGTLWCGMRDNAKNYEDIGDNIQLDKCCRDHDHCPIKVGSFQTRYGVSNFGLATRSHCLCDNEFYKCLKNCKDETAKAVGDFYFNLLRISCVEEPVKGSSNFIDDNSVPLYMCTKRDDQRQCRMWKKNGDHSSVLETKKPAIEF